MAAARVFGLGARAARDHDQFDQVSGCGWVLGLRSLRQRRAARGSALKARRICRALGRRAAASPECGTVRGASPPLFPMGSGTELGSSLSSLPAVRSCRVALGGASGWPEAFRSLLFSSLLFPPTGSAVYCPLCVFLGSVLSCVQCLGGRAVGGLGAGGMGSESL